MFNERTEHILAHLPDYLMGQLESELRAGVERHLDICAECRSELERLRDLLGLLEVERSVERPTNYFETLLPRIRQRLEERAPLRAFSRPVVRRLLAPLAVLALAAALLLHVRFPGSARETASGLLGSFAEGLTSQEVTDAVLADTHPVTPMAEGGVGSILALQSVERQLLAGVFDLFPAAYGEELLGVIPSDLLAEFDEQDIDRLIERLGERRSL